MNTNQGTLISRVKPRPQWKVYVTVNKISLRTSYLNLRGIEMHLKIKLSSALDAGLHFYAAPK